jgi:hypothetical protein
VRLASELDVAGKRVLVRSDLNVPVKDGAVGDDGRIRASVPLLRDLLDRGALPVVMAHLGRPKGEPDPASSLAPVGERLQELLGAPVRMAQDVVGESATEAVRATEADRVVLLENVRWAPGRRARTTPSAAPSPTASPPSPTCTSTTRSERSTASTPACTTSRPGCRRPPGRSSPPRSASCSGSRRTRRGRTPSSSAAAR